MLIDWFTVAAQALNFLVLVWLMKRFLYKPILKAIDAREKIIAGELSEAAAKKAEAKKEQEQFQSKNAAFDLERAALLSKATNEAKAENQKLISEARTAADVLHSKRMEALETEARNLNESITLRAKQEIFAIARKTLADLASASLEENISEVFIQRLKTLDEKIKETLGQALKTGTAPAVVRSAFDLGEEQRTAIQKTLKEIFSAEIPLRYETNPDLGCGIELISNGQKIEWNIANYLTLLEKDFTDLFKRAIPAGEPSDLSPETKTLQPTEAKPAPQQKGSEHAA